MRLKVAGHVNVPEEYGIGLLHRDHFARSHVCSTESTAGKRLLKFPVQQHAIRIGPDPTRTRSSNTVLSPRGSSEEISNPL